MSRYRRRAPRRPRSGGGGASAAPSSPSTASGSDGLRSWPGTRSGSRAESRSQRGLTTRSPGRERSSGRSRGRSWRRSPSRSARLSPVAGPASLKARELNVILTVTLNAAIDRTVAVPNFRLGQRHRAVESRTVAGGKGVNVARALKLLGRPVIATGFVGGPTGTRVVEQLQSESVLTDFIRIAGETRINLAVIDPTSGEQSEIAERGPAVSPEEVVRFVERLDYLAAGAKLCVLAGTLPPGAGDDLYAQLIKDLAGRGV